MSKLGKKLKKVSAFFARKRAKPRPKNDIALLVIDTQKGYCDPAYGRGNAETDRISGEIQTLSQAFRAASVPVYAIYTAPRKLRNPANIDFHKFTPEPEDTLIHKESDSAFKGRTAKKVLEKDKRKKLLACGFNLSACVYRTLVDARRKGFQVCLLRDLSCNDNYEDNPTDDIPARIKTMIEEGIAIADSAEALTVINSKDQNAINALFFAPITAETPVQKKRSLFKLWERRL